MRNFSARTGSGLNMVLPALFGIAIFLYASYHAVSGDRGLFTFLQLSRKAEQTYLELDNLQKQRMALEKKVSLLREESLDLDLLDEQARRILGYAHPDETVYPVLR